MKLLFIPFNHLQAVAQLQAKISHVPNSLGAQHSQTDLALPSHSSLGKQCQRRQEDSAPGKYS